ncbi:hypothetical protein [Clostridium sp.]|jgi:hypothetical protein|uniref:hypothetical protein n=1 Tax=Clostridium sp. TaxID=1506 RepID=UPI0025802215|nr:hypothetical protein [Clostridium sp.]MBE6057483.1 hypothetical protein [Clostridium sp.]
MKKKILSVGLAIVCSMSLICIFPTAVIASEVEPTLKTIEINERTEAGLTEAVNRTMDRLEGFYDESYDEYEIFNKNDIKITQEFYEATYEYYVSGDWEYINTYCENNISRIQRRTFLPTILRSGDIAMRERTGLYQLMEGSISGGHTEVTCDVEAYIYYNPNTYVISQTIGPRLLYTNATSYSNIQTRSNIVNKYKATFTVSFKVNQIENNIFDDWGYFNQSFSVQPR